ncbi:MAG: hypothetical protein HDS68_05265 [Bacteroidales bacterium]|nr:hypothetical protein [Bacteroidales bacterium]
MKYRIITLIVSIIFCINGYADGISPNNPPDINIKVVVKNKGGRNTMSPIPECKIIDNIIYAASPNDWSYATIVVTETKTDAVSIGAGYLDEGIEVYLPASNGNFTITITTETDDEFVGTFDL